MAKDRIIKIIEVKVDIGDAKAEVQDLMATISGGAITAKADVDALSKSTANIGASYKKSTKTIVGSTGKTNKAIKSTKREFDGLGWSVAQLTREAPAFANSIQTGMMAISNNIYMLSDEFGKLKKQGLSTGGALKKVGTALMSMPALIGFFSAAITVLVPMLWDWINADEELIKQEKELKKIRESWMSSKIQTVEADIAKRKKAGLDTTKEEIHLKKLLGEQNSKLTSEWIDNNKKIEESEELKRKAEAGEYKTELKYSPSSNSMRAYKIYYEFSKEQEVELATLKRDNSQIETKLNQTQIKMIKKVNEEKKKTVKINKDLNKTVPSSPENAAKRQIDADVAVISSKKKLSTEEVRLNALSITNDKNREDVLKNIKRQESQDVIDSLEIQKEMYESFGYDTVEIERKIAAEKVKIKKKELKDKEKAEKDYAKEAIDLEKKIADEKKSIKLAAVELSYAISDLFMSLAGEDKKRQATAIRVGEAVAIGNIGMSTVVGAMKAIETYEYPLGLAFAAIIGATGIAAAASAHMSAKEALSALGEGGGGGGSIPPIPKVSQISSAQEVTSADQVAGIMDKNINTPTRAYVVSSDITSQQELDRQTRKKASI